jgi:CheY-like chemotaxis protein
MNATIQFPIAALTSMPEQNDDALVEQIPGANRESQPTPGETVLVVEDNHQVREIIRLTLRGRGYTVLEASCGREAINLCESHKGRIHLLVTDMVMPQMSGREVADRVDELRPGIKTLFLSGHQEETLERYGGIEADESFLAKPFGLGKFVSTIRDILDNE